tara:strand:+ start:318 stop:521 length:204 start_codon:yes stop_codon:yes gene_type:complete
MNKATPQPISTTTTRKIDEFRNLTKVSPSPKCFEGSIAKQLGHLSVLKKKGKMSDDEITQTKKLILE